MRRRRRLHRGALVPRAVVRDGHRPDARARRGAAQVDGLHGGGRGAVGHAGGVGHHVLRLFAGVVDQDHWPVGQARVVQRRRRGGGEAGRGVAPRVRGGPVGGVGVRHKGVQLRVVRVRPLSEGHGRRGLLALLAQLQHGHQRAAAGAAAVRKGRQGAWTGAVAGVGARALDLRGQSFRLARGVVHPLAVGRGPLKSSRGTGPVPSVVLQPGDSDHGRGADAHPRPHAVRRGLHGLLRFMLGEPVPAARRAHAGQGADRAARKRPGAPRGGLGHRAGPRRRRSRRLHSRTRGGGPDALCHRALRHPVRRALRGGRRHEALHAAVGVQAAALLPRPRGQRYGGRRQKGRLRADGRALQRRLL
mmetsp:Transcript_19104/g.65634  ORF Transcript_19104/g.65634 Transcript_19104/m.65634 type:complete len:361 (+) Transcript_19104:1827-2909(+)